MKSIYTIVINDNKILSSLCGTNDENLRLIEEYLDADIFTKGNELSISYENKVYCERFKYAVEIVSQKLSLGAAASKDLIISVMESLNEEDKKILSDFCIKIPYGLKSVYPKNKSQANLISSMRKFDVVFCAGPAGTGKTFIAIAEALSELLSKKRKKVFLTRPVVEAGENLGFLPGDFEQKLHPYLRPLYDSMEDLLPFEVLKKITENGSVEIAPLAYMRGRTLSDCVIILDEAQNTTVEQMKMFLTRLGENAKIIITGDDSQIDLSKKVRSGFVHALDILSDIEEIGIVKMDVKDVVRSDIVKKIIQAYDNAEK